MFFVNIKKLRAKIDVTKSVLTILMGMIQFSIIAFDVDRRTNLGWNNTKVGDVGSGKNSDEA